MLWKRVPLNSPTAEQIQHWGGNFGPLTFGGQPWRLLTAICVHIGIAHVAANLWALLVLGRLAESLYGRFAFLLIYMLAGISGGIATLAWNPMATSAGASGALFGIAGALVVTLYFGKLPMPKRAVRPVLISLAVWAIFSLLYGFRKSGTDNAAHIGGLLAGVLLGFGVANHLGLEYRDRRWRKRVFVLAAIIVSCAGLVVWRQQAYVVPFERARELLIARKYDEAVSSLRNLAQSEPGKAAVHALLADALLHTKSLVEAEREYRRAIDLQPKSALTWGKLAELYAKQDRWADAASAYLRAAQLDKDNAYFIYNAGLMYRREDRHQEAVALFQQVVARNAYFVDAWYAMGISLLNLKRASEAMPALQKAAELRPNDPEIHLWLGNAMMTAGHEQEAQAEFAKAYELKAKQQRVLQEIQRRKQSQQRSR